MSEDTVAGPCEDLTEVIPPDQMVTQAAWSLDGSVYDYPPTLPPTPSTPSTPHRSGYLVAAGAAVAVMVGAVALAALVPIWREPPWRIPSPPAPPTPTFTLPTYTATVTAPPTVTETLPPSTVTQSPVAQAPDLRTSIPQVSVPQESSDDRYTRQVTRDLRALGLVVFDPGPVIATGRSQCAYLAIHPSIPAANAHLRRQYGALTVDQADAITRDAIAAYCPQFSDG